MTVELNNNIHYSCYVYIFNCIHQTHGSVSAAKKNKKTGKNRTPHTSVCYLREP